MPLAGVCTAHAPLFFFPSPRKDGCFKAQNSPARRGTPGMPLLDVICCVPTGDSPCRKAVLELGSGWIKRKKTVTEIKSY
jgi:hypothetical protein